MTRTLVFVTGNANKLRETRTILLARLQGFDLQSRDLDIPELRGTTADVSREKCRTAAKLIDGPCITEDTALCFEALGGLPGPYIKWFFKSIGHDGLNRMLDGFPTRAATAVCTFAYSAGPGTEPILFEGRTEGRIVPARGDGQFGWDPIFQPVGKVQTYAEMTAEDKNGISHRYRALDKLCGYLGSLPANE